MTTMVNLPTIVQTRALAPKSSATTALSTVAQTASKAGGYGKLVAALAGLAVLGTETYLACKNPSDEEKAN